MAVKHVTLEDIAARLEISKYSVSRALSGKSGVSALTRELVLDTARDLDYRHPAVTSHLAGPQEDSQSGSIVLLIPREDVHDSEFWMDVISGAEEEAQRLGFALITRPLSHDNPSAQPASLTAPSSWGQGVIVAGSQAREAVSAHLGAGLPAVLITYPKPLEAIDTVTIGDWEGGVTVAKHLLNLGHKQLAFVTERPQKPSNKERARGFQEVLSEAGLTLETLHLKPENPGVDFEEAFSGLLKRKRSPTAIFASTDGVAFMVIWALNRLGLKVPDDVSVVGFNDTLQASQFVPRLTTLRVPKRHIGAAAMQSLFQQIRGEDRDGPPRRLSLAPEFILRDSTAPPKHPS